MTDQDLPFPDNSLAPHEEQRFQALEQTVEGSLRDFQRTGQALAEIRIPRERQPVRMAASRKQKLEEANGT